MSNRIQEDDAQLYSAMHEGRPYASYKKTILAKVFINRLNSFLGIPEGIIIEGDPKKDEGIIDTWSAREDLFFRQMNANHFKNGTLISYKRKEEAPKRTIEQATDEELMEIVSLRYLALQNKLNTITTTPVLYRILDMAVENEKSEKIVKLIEARIAEVQNAEFLPQNTKEEVTDE